MSAPTPEEHEKMMSDIKKKMQELHLEKEMINKEREPQVLHLNRKQLRTLKAQRRKKK